MPEQLTLNGRKEKARSACQIISASRRTDLPAFQASAFMQQLRAGEAVCRNPFNRRLLRTSLRPENVHTIVFWSKDYRPLLPHLDELGGRGYNLYFLFTITGLPRALEPHVPDMQTGIETLSYLSSRFSPKHVSWRFDPIAFAPGLEEKETLARFAHMAQALEGKTKRCYVSFLHFYAKARRSLRAPGIACFDPPRERKRALLAQLAEIAADHKIGLFGCCGDDLLCEGVNKGHCIDGDLLAELSPDKPAIRELRPTRPSCGCFASRDIGTYGTCRHGCRYCYAG